MDLLVNDLSLHGQFEDIASFRMAIGQVMSMRQVAQRYGRALHCHRNMAHSSATRDLSLMQAVQHLSVNERRALLQWLTKHGPFWEDAQQHGPDHYLACRSEIVTDSAIGEAAFCCINGTERQLVSLAPSSWEFSPVSVTWIRPGTNDVEVGVLNHWQPAGLERALQAAPRPLVSWQGLAAAAALACSGLTFLPECFEPLRGRPFSEAGAQRVLTLLGVLHRFKTCFGPTGERTKEGQDIYQTHFTGDNSWFSDSSDTEKREFESELRFRHPHREGQFLWCTWHGKVRVSQMRVHFSWPVRADEPLYVAYVGPKLTKR